MFLCMINDVMNYYISRIDDEVRYPLLYIPASEVWAQEICIEFVTLKLSLLYNRLIQIKLRADIERACMTLPMDCSAKSKNSNRHRTTTNIQSVFITILRTGIYRKAVSTKT